jgi:hypothetical protein
MLLGGLPRANRVQVAPCFNVGKNGYLLEIPDPDAK